MDASEPPATELLSRARTGDDDARGRLLEAYRSYWTLLTRVQLGRDLQGKVDPSDLVQEAFLEAHRDFAQFQGQTEAVLPGIPSNSSKGVVGRGEPMNRAVLSLVGVAGGALGSARANRQGADVAPVGWPAVAAGVSLPNLPPALVARAPEPALSGAGVTHGDTGPDVDVAPFTSAPADPSLPDFRVPAEQVTTRAASPVLSPDGSGELSAAAVDGFFQAVGRWAGGLIRSGADEGQAAGPAAGGAVLFALLGNTWAARDGEPKSRQPVRRRRG